MKCPKCGYDIKKDEVVTIFGIADVSGTSTFEDFVDVGIEWEIDASSEEHIKCPKCDKSIDIRLFYEEVEK